MRRINKQFVEEDLHGLKFDTDALAYELYHSGVHDIVGIITKLFEKTQKEKEKQDWQKNTVTWKKYVDTGQNTGLALPKHSYFGLSYEDLIQNPEEKLTQVCDFLSEKFSPSMVDFQKSKDPKTKTHLLKMPIQKSNREKWQSKMHLWQCYILESVAGDTLKKNNYPVTTPAKPSPMVIDKLYSAHNKLCR